MRRVLLVDDDENTRARLATNLRMAGFSVLACESARATMQAVDEMPFDAAIVELLLPEVHGLALARQLQARMPAARVFVTSAFELSRCQLDRIGLGRVGFIRKSSDGTDAVKKLCATWARNEPWAVA